MKPYTGNNSIDPLSENIDSLKYKEQVFGQNSTVPLVPGREPNSEVWEVIARLPVYEKYFEQLKRISDWIDAEIKKNGGKLF